jgi:hypothetical protein
MDLDTLARQYKGKITFWGEIDRRLLYSGNPDKIRKAVRKVKSLLYDERGGIIAQCEWGKDNPPENIEAVYETWYGV